ncbi:MAG: ribonuclease Z [Candidatus Micrarchaeaceae archaeon]
MLKITFLGTAGSTPTKFRGLPGLALEYNGELLLFDCGEGTQRQMMYYSINISKIKAVFLTHIHGDHTIGIAGLVRTLALNRRTEPLYIFIPKGHEKQIWDIIKFDNAIMNYKIIVKPIKTGIIYSGKNYTVSAFKLMHTIPTYGLVFREEDKIKFIKQKIKKLNIKGTMFKELLKNKSIKLKGRTIKLSDVTFAVKGKKITYATDTRPTKETVSASLGSDLLIHESTYADSEKELAKERYHSTSLEAATAAKAAKVKRLVLTHISARYKDTSSLLKDAKRKFKNSEVAKDGMIINL